MLTRDDRLPRKALKVFNDSRMRSGLMQSRYPSRPKQIIPPFSLWWVTMVHDYAHCRDELEFVSGLMPGVGAVLDCYLNAVNTDGLLASPRGWNFADWVPVWTEGVPPAGDGICGLFNWQIVLVLGLAADHEAIGGEAELAARAHRRVDELAARTTAVFWDEERGLFADGIAKTSFSEHTYARRSSAANPRRKSFLELVRRL